MADTAYFGLENRINYFQQFLIIRSKQRKKSTENVCFQSFLHFIISFHIHNKDKNELNKIPYLNFEEEI